MSTLTKCKQQRKNEKIIARIAWFFIAGAAVYIAGHVIKAYLR